MVFEDLGALASGIRRVLQHTSLPSGIKVDVRGMIRGMQASFASFGFGLILPRVSTRTIAILAMAFSVAIELSQLYHAPWIDSIRHTTLGGLILGFGFLWSDLVCYAVGVGLGLAIENIGGIVPGKDQS